MPFTEQVLYFLFFFLKESAFNWLLSDVKKKNKIKKQLAGWELIVRQ